jgi:hypothetical protein
MSNKLSSGRTEVARELSIKQISFTKDRSVFGFAGSITNAKRGTAVDCALFENDNAAFITETRCRCQHNSAIFGLRILCILKPHALRNFRGVR